jgi:hypothetical protein
MVVKILVFYVMASFGAGELAGLLIAYGGAGGAILGAGVIYLAVRGIQSCVAKMFDGPEEPKLWTF